MNESPARGRHKSGLDRGDLRRVRIQELVEVVVRVHK